MVRIEVTSRAEVLAGRAFGDAGSYEKLAGTLHFAVDPRSAANRIITDIDKAPRNAAGLVEFSSDFYLIKPRDPARGNGTVLYEVSNRGGKSMLGFFDFAAGSLNPGTAAEFGDGFLLERGITLAWLGWQFDGLPRDPQLLRLYGPVAREGGRAIAGRLRSEVVPDKRVLSFSLGGIRPGPPRTPAGTTLPDRGARVT